MMHFISLGAGVQSSTMALMASHGEIQPMPDGAIFADTQDEPKLVYEWLDWLEKKLLFPVYRVTAGNLMADALRLRLSRKSGNTYLATGLPVFLDVNGDNGIGMRQCTRTFKIDVIRRKLRELRKGQPIVQWIGISFDECDRMKLSRDKWCTNIWPLVDRGMTRNDCLDWLESKHYPRAPRSACKKCPYHGDAEWLDMKKNRPEEFRESVLFEQALQAKYIEATALNRGAIPYLHDSRQPLNTVDFCQEESQPSLFSRECEGKCGV